MRFLRSIQQDAKLFIDIYILLMLFRCAFLVIYSGQLGNAGAGDIAEALWLGARISLKTTSFLVLSFCCLHSYQPLVFQPPLLTNEPSIQKMGKKSKQFDQNKCSFFLWSATIFPSWNAAYRSPGGFRPLH